MVQMPSKHLPRAEAIADALAAAIASGRYPAGSLLPGERPLCASLGVGRPLLREAMRLLVSRGLVESRHGQGNRVIADHSRPVRGAITAVLQASGSHDAHLLELRLAVETAVAAAAAQRRSQEDLAAIDAILAEAAATADTALPALAELDVAFHARLAVAARNPLFDLVLAPLSGLLRQYRPAGLKRMGLDSAHADHGAIRDAVRDGQPAAAAEAMRRHLDRLRR